MKTYLHLYRWAMQMKLHMAIYTLTAIFLKGLYCFVRGEYAISLFDLLTMWITCLLFAIVETVIFPEGCPCTRKRSLIWLSAANLLFLGGAFAFKWFSGIPLWGGLLLTAFLELGLGLMWFGDRFVLRMDSADLTRQLRRYQQSKNS